MEFWNWKEPKGELNPQILQMSKLRQLVSRSKTSTQFSWLPIRCSFYYTTQHTCVMAKIQTQSPPCFSNV